MVSIREERPGDVLAREALIDAAFGDERRTKTCERLREGRRAADELSLVATERGRLVGTLRFWHVGAGSAGPALMLGPLVVDPAARSRGLGAALVREGLARAQARGHTAVLLVGDAPYYARFGFTAAHTAALTLPGPYAPERFLAIELQGASLAGAHGLVRPTGARAVSFGSRRRRAPARRTTRSAASERLRRVEKGRLAATA